jgi:hypothetical protein
MATENICEGFPQCWNKFLGVLQTPGLYQVHQTDKDQTNDTAFLKNWSVVLLSASVLLSVRLVYASKKIISVSKNIMKFSARAYLYMFLVAVAGMLSLLLPIAAFTFLLIKLYQSTLAVENQGIEVATHFAVILGLVGAYFSSILSEGNHWENILSSKPKDLSKATNFAARRIGSFLEVPYNGRNMN